MSTAPSERTRVHRHPERGDYDRPTIDAILDESLLCHLAWVTAEGEPRVIPTIHVRVGDTLYVHGSQASRTLRAMRAGAQVCIETTIIDGLVLARSTPKHSMNYRSVVVFGAPREVTDRDEMDVAQRALTEHVVIVLAAGIARHHPAACRRGTPCPRVVDESDHDQAARSGQQTPRIDPLFDAPADVRHLAGIAARQPLAQEPGFGSGFGLRDAHQVEAQTEAERLDPIGELDGRG